MKPINRTLPGWVHIPLFVFMAISFVQTALGFQELFGMAFAWAFSLAITMVMYGFTFFVGQRRINRLPVQGFIVAYVLFSLFSFAGNFNAVYTSYQKEQLYRDELLEHREHLHDVVNASHKALNNFNPGLDSKRGRVESLTKQLVSQISDPARPGLGQRARELIYEIERLLGERLTEFGAAGVKPEELARRYQENIEQIANRKLTSKDYNKAQEVRALIDRRQAETSEMIDEILQSNQAVKDFGFETNLKAVNAINEIGSATQEAVNGRVPFKFDKAKFKNQEIGKIAFSFKSGFSEHPLVAILFSILCIFIDWAVLLSLLVFFGRNEKELPLYTSNNKGL